MTVIKYNTLLIFIVIVSFIQFSCDEFDIIKLAERGKAIAGTPEPTIISTPESTVTKTTEPIPLSTAEPTTTPMPDYAYVCGSVLSGDPITGFETLTVNPNR